MARVEIDYVAQATNPTTGAVTAASGASVQINARNADGTSGSASTVYLAATTGTTVANPRTADTAGRIEGWLDPGPYNFVVTGANIVSYTQPVDIPGNVFATVASAGTVALPLGATVVNITGTTGITSISAGTSDPGRIVTLVFSGALTVTDGSNLKLSANFTTTADDTLTVACDGTNWFEVARSVN